MRFFLLKNDWFKSEQGPLALLIASFTLYTRVRVVSLNIIGDNGDLNLSHHYQIKLNSYIIAMGCFNTVLIDCPHCGKEIEEQSKGGSCLMKSNKLESANVADVMAVSNSPIECYHCEGKLIVKSKITVVTSVEKL